MRMYESGSLWNGDTYDIYIQHGHFVLEVNGKFHSSGDTMNEIHDDIEELEKAARNEKIVQLN